MPLFGTRLSNLYRVLPCIVAELAVDVSFPEGNGRVHHDRGSRVYFILRGEKPLEQPTAEVLVRTKLNRLRLREFPWDHFRQASIAEVPSQIAEKCFLDDAESMKEILDAITAKIPDSIADGSLFTLPSDLI